MLCAELRLSFVLMAFSGSIMLGASLFLLLDGCAVSTPPSMAVSDTEVARGPWSEVPAVEMPTGDASIPISLLRDVAEALLNLPRVTACDSGTRRPVVGLSTEYCSTVYVAGGRACSGESCFLPPVLRGEG